MDWLQALLLGILQGLTEFLPVSSSGHLTILSNIFGMSGEENLTFNVVLHVATVCATLVVLWQEVVWIFKDLFAKQQWNSYKNLNGGTKYAINIIISMIPVGIVGVFFKDTIEDIFGSGLLIVGIMLLVTATLLTFAQFAKPRQRENISGWHAFIIGIGQACATMPGLSRSGTTIATGLLLGNKKERLAQFSFLMVIPPILGEALLDAKDVLEVYSLDTAFSWSRYEENILLDAKDVLEVGWHSAMAGISPLALIIGFLAAFITGCMACKWMISIVKKGKLVYFAIYCVIVGILAICFA